MAAAKTFVTPERLPPTASAACFHSLRTYYQVMAWMDKARNMDPTNWGWQKKNNRFTPIMTDMRPAPGPSSKSSVAIVQLVAPHSDVPAESMACSVPWLVDHGRISLAVTLWTKLPY